MLPDPHAAPRPPVSGDVRGVALCGLLLAGWTLSLVPVLRPAALTVGDGWWALPLVLLRTWLCTGVFICAHDAMHGVLAPGRPWLNDRLGGLCAALYAAFSFRAMREAHHLHHAAPASPHDPDWHDGQHAGPVRWFLAFQRRYLRWWQVLIIAVVFNIGQLGFGLRALDLWLLVAAPALLSSVQLFYFGTYLPHREHGAPFLDAHRARSSGWPPAISLLSCFHFGYHLAHHRFPFVPWWGLPAAEAHLQAQGSR
jgi:beta-carotene ketolase (CrtW type)